MKSHSNKKTDLSTTNHKTESNQSKLIHENDGEVSEFSTDAYKRTKVHENRSYGNKKIKTEGRIDSENHKAIIKDETKEKSKIAYLKTSVEKAEGNDEYLNHRFTEEDHQNTGSLAELLEFRNDFDEEDDELLKCQVRKMTERSGSNFNESRVDIDEERDQEKSEKHNMSLKEEDRQSSQNQSNKSISFRKDSNLSERLNIRQSTDSITSYSVNPEEPKKKKKAKIRSYSQEEKEALIKERKYVPKTEEELRMEKRYFKGQLAIINEIREKEEIVNFMNAYQQSKRLILQQSMKKLETTNMLNNIKKNRVTFEQSAFEMKRSLSLPKLKKSYQEYILPGPESCESQEIKNAIKNAENLDGSLSGFKHHYYTKKASIINKAELIKSEKEEEIENIISIEKILRSKGVTFESGVIRKGLMVGQSFTPDNELKGKVEAPKNLVSNPKYQKYPL